MPSVPTYLRNHQAVINAFGYWPDFHDSPVLSFRADAESIILGLAAIREKTLLVHLLSAFAVACLRS